MPIGNKLRTLRKVGKITQDELASTIGVSRNSIVKWESSEVEPGAEKVKLIAEYFGVEVGELYGDSHVSERNTLESRLTAIEAKLAERDENIVEQAKDKDYEKRAREIVETKAFHAYGNKKTLTQLEKEQLIRAIAEALEETGR